MLADYLILGYFACLCCVVLLCVAWRNCVINFTVLLCIIFMHMFYRVTKGIYQFAANLLSYIPTKYYWNRSTSDLVIAKSKRVNFFETQCTYTRCSDKLGTLFLSLLSQANVDRFSKFFHQVICRKILCVYITKISTSSAMCCYTTLWKSKIQKCYQIFTLNVTICLTKI